uniref:putative transcription factor bHLH041 n=1 Tax=Fragaria vesca subsp. vesca TaxID=101020 RepID=UPI0005C94E46|nr:PREDICTED: putative transcription factor bHLH041 [Fragaria vesca subsp. vesca]
MTRRYSVNSDKLNQIGSNRDLALSLLPPLYLYMDTAFELDEVSRANFLKLVMQSFSCSYICLWRSYFPNCLMFFDGVYDEENQTGSSSSSGVSLARRLFDEYRLSIFPIVQNECVPGFAFRNSLTYVELQEMDLQRLASVQIQKQFYQEARIKTAVFMGCKSGEIELGFANVSQMNVKKELIMRSWMLPEAFSKSQLLSPRTVEGASTRANTEQQNQLSSSSSSLRSLSTMDSPECSSLIFNTVQTSTAPSSLNIPPDQVFANTNFTSLLQPVVSPTTNIFSSTSTSPHQQAMQAISRMRGNIHLPAPEIEDAEITRAILAVLTSPSSSPSPAISPHQLSSDSAPSPSHHGLLNPKPCSAFKHYISSPLGPRTQTKGAANLGVRKQTMVKRSISFLRSLNLLRIRDQSMQAATRPTTSQLHHMISERKRREKLNESFHSLKSLLPPGTKKDKASVLTTARDYLTSLQAQVDELSKRNQQLEAAARLITKEEDDEEEEAGSSSTERVSVTLTHVSGSTTDQNQRIVALQVIVRSGECSTEDIVIRILEFLKQVNNMSLMSMEASTWKTELHPNINRVVLRLRVDNDQANEWDESAFQEAVRRVVADVAYK